MAIDTGVIAIWSGTLATIPANWNLCDGSGVTPNLVARFLRGAPAATNPGTTGGADSHNHASMTAAGSHSHRLPSSGYQSHSHTVNSGGSHSHGSHSTAGYSTYEGMSTASKGAHSHTTSSDSHYHTTPTDSNHTHTINSSDGRPPYYEVAFIQAGAGAACAAGLIIIWTGTLATIPAGWDLCDGSAGRPDLRSRFLRGVNTNATDPGTTGGATTHTHTTTTRAHTHGGTSNSGGSHYHTFSSYTWTHDHNTASWTVGALGPKQTDSGAGNHTHSNTNTTGSHSHSIGSGGSHSHTGAAASSLPVYYAVAYIYNTAAAAIPSNGILLWTGTLATIPSGYQLCDGAAGRPDLRGRFVYGTAAGVDPGATGGADSHTHTPSSAGGHSDHSIGSAGAHQHNATNSTGSHTHLQTTPIDISVGVTKGNNASNGSHSHTFNNENSHNHSDSYEGAHTHNPWSTDDGRPAYYEVAYIQYGVSQPPSLNMAAKMVSSGVI